jgi:hypothetical protein
LRWYTFKKINIVPAIPAAKNPISDHISGTIRTYSGTLGELSYKEISEVLGLTEDNVGVKLNRIKTKLRVLIGANR